MGMTPTDYFEAFVEGNNCDCHESPGDVRRAFNAAVSAAHLVDHFYHYCKRHCPERLTNFSNLGEFMDEIAVKTNGAFHDIRGIANAYKHLYTSTTSPQASVYVSSAGAIESIELESDPALAELSAEYADQREMVVFTRRNKTRGVFLPALDEVTRYLHELVYATTHDPAA